MHAQRHMFQRATAVFCTLVTGGIVGGASCTAQPELQLQGDSERIGSVADADKVVIVTPPNPFLDPNCDDDGIGRVRHNAEFPLHEVGTCATDGFTFAQAIQTCAQETGGKVQYFSYGCSDFPATLPYLPNDERAFTAYFGCCLGAITLNDSGDAHVRTDLAERRNDNYGCQESLDIGTSRGGNNDYVGAPDAIRTLIKFNLSDLPGHTAIRTATLRLALRGFGEGSPGTVFTIDVHRVVPSGSRTPWIEGNGAENLFHPPGCVDVDTAFGVAWVGAGDGGDANNQTQPNFASTIIARRQVVEGMNQLGDLVDFDITSLARGWQRGLFPNYGVVLRDPTQSSPPAFREVLFGSKEGEKFDFPDPNNPSQLLPKVPGPRLILDLCSDEDHNGRCDD